MFQTPHLVKNFLILDKLRNEQKKSSISYDQLMAIYPNANFYDGKVNIMTDDGLVY